MHTGSPSAGVLAIAGAGGIVVVLTLVDIFITLFAYDGFTFLAPRMHRALWGAVREASRTVPRRSRAAALSLGSAALLPATLVLWLALETAGFGMVYMPGLAAGSFSVAHKAGSGAESAFYLSGGDLTSLTFGDLVPRTGFYRAMVDVETMIGLATFTLALTYVLSAFDALAKLHSMYSRVRRNAIEPNRPATIIERRFRHGDASYFSDFLHNAVEDLVAYDDGLHRFPVAFYFHTRRMERSTPHILAALGQLIELSRWGLPASEPVTDDPNLLALAAEYRAVLLRMRDYFLPHLHGSDEPIPGPEEFARAAVIEGTEAAAFEALRREAAGASDLPDHDDAETRYQRFAAWTDFHRTTSSVVTGLSRVLGYDLER